VPRYVVSVGVQYIFAHEQLKSYDGLRIGITRKMDTFDRPNGLALTTRRDFAVLFGKDGAYRVGAVEYVTAGSEVVALGAWLVPRMWGADDLDQPWITDENEWLTLLG